MRIILLLLLLSGPANAQASARAFPYLLTGTLTDNSGAAISGGTVTLERLPPYPKGRMWAKIVYTSSDSTGAFRFDSGLGPGSYRLCADLAGAAWLNPCKWGSAAPTVTLSASESAVSFALVVNKGAVVPILVQDPAQLILKNLGVTAGANLLLGVGDDAFIFETASLTSQSSTMRNYQVLIPYDRTVNLVVASSFFQLANALGVALPSKGSTSIPITVRGGQQPAAVTLSIAGSAQAAANFRLRDLP